MAYSVFNSKGYEILLWRIRLCPLPSSGNDFALFKLAINDLIAFVSANAKWQNLLIIHNCTDGEDVDWIASCKRLALDRAMQAVKTLTDLAEEYCTEPMYTGNPTYPHTVAFFCEEVTLWLFKQRDRLMEMSYKVEGS